MSKTEHSPERCFGLDFNLTKCLTLYFELPCLSFEIVKCCSMFKFGAMCSGMDLLGGCGGGAGGTHARHNSAPELAAGGAPPPPLPDHAGSIPECTYVRSHFPLFLRNNTFEGHLKKANSGSEEY